MSKYQDKLNEFSQRVLEAVGKKEAPWQKPWKEGILMEFPKNVTTDNNYKGVNLINMAMSGYNDPRWLTYNQAKGMDCTVRKGEKATAGFFYSPTRLEKERDAKGKLVLDQDGKQKMVKVNKPTFRYFSVFNATQVEGMKEYKQLSPAWKPEEKAENLLKAAGVTIVESQLDRAFYNPAAHTIETPPKSQFAGKTQYYSMIFHELGHATKHESMLNRAEPTIVKEITEDSKEKYAKEELRAEISAWLVCTQIGIGYEPNAEKNNEAYVSGWLSKLNEKDRTKELGMAIKDAEKISDYVMGLDKEKAASLEKNSEKQIPDQSISEQATQSRVADENKFSSTEKIYINVPYAQKGEAKALGAKWDKQQKSWFVQSDAEIQPFEKWLEPVQENRLNMNKVFSQFQERASRLGLKIDTPQADGKLHRVAVEGDKTGQKSGAYILHADGRPAGYIENHKAGKKTNFKFEGEIGKIIISPVGKKARDLYRENNYADAAKKAFGIYVNAPKIKEHPYLVAKKINGHKEYRVDNKNRLIIPARNLKTNKIESLQFISEDGEKKLLYGSKKAGNAYTIGDIDEQKPILLTEGFATGTTLHDVSHLPAVVCFDANNLENVAKQIKELMPSAELFICADNDHAKKNNVGVEKAKEAAKTVGAKVIIPKFTDASKKLGHTDFNDLAQCKMGKQRVKDQLQTKIPYLSKNQGIGLER